MFKKKGMATATHECSVFIISISLPSISCHKDLGNTKATSQDGSFFFFKVRNSFFEGGWGKLQLQRMEAVQCGAGATKKEEERRNI